MSNKTRNAAGEIADPATEVMDKEVESAVEAVLEVGAIVDEALAESAAETAPSFQAEAEALLEEQETSNGARRFMRRGGIVLVTAAVAVGAGVLVAMVLRSRGSEDAEDDLPV